MVEYELFIFVIRMWLIKSFTCEAPKSNVPSALRLIFDFSSKVPKLFLNYILPLEV